MIKIKCPQCAHEFEAGVGKKHAPDKYDPVSHTLCGMHVAPGSRGKPSVIEITLSAEHVNCELCLRKRRKASALEHEHKFAAQLEDSGL